jgi:AraC-like DNA-binding protein
MKIIQRASQNQQNLQPIPLVEKQAYSLKKQAHCNSKDWTSRAHFHTMVEAVLYESIKGTAFLDGEEWEIETGKFMFIPSYVLHHFSLRAGEAIYHVAHFNESFISTFLPKNFLPSFPFVAQLSADDFNFFKHLLCWRNEKTETASPKVQAECLKLMITWIGEHLIPPDYNQKDKITDVFRPVFKFLNDNDLFTISIQEASDLCQLSRSHFMGEFKKKFGVTFNEFLTTRKMDAAKNYITQTDQSLTEIAHRLQLNDSSYFSKIFKDHFQCSPRDYKKSLKIWP